MNRAIVVGAYEFLGFHLTMKLLDRGLEVTGIVPGSMGDDRYTADKELLVGRNANFTVYSEADWKAKGSIEEPHLIFLSLYDYYFREEPELASWEGMFGHLEASIEETGSKPVILMPVQYYGDREEGSCHAGALKIYLPTLFGRWQPSAFAFQRTIEGLGKKDNAMLEHKGDAIHAAEAAEGIIEAAETKGSGTLLLWSGEKGRWGKCAQHLGMKEPADCSPPIAPEADRKIIREETPYHIVLDKQQEYVKRGADSSSRLSGPGSPKVF
ncbi:NAD(P)-dependent oxidoreductase [Bacillus infantis]|uniref:NAD(P)-dependent oxidoreductase n=1 Tax=Bacillus infantis TaxID=324767 RepID=A0A5D4R837_9BACI|nr:NAD(P)-dependent oxidoreductase [Bacillus infantis]TYS46214.1 NAD(P)-dependent oxidoreductase [Bacillus infantis]